MNIWGKAKLQKITFFLEKPHFWFTVILLALGWKAVLYNSDGSRNDGIWCIRLESRTQLTHSFSVFMEPKWGLRCWALNETISANSLIKFHLKWSTFFLQIAWQAAERKESSLSRLLWVLLVSLFEVAGRRQGPIIFGDELLLQSYKGMTSGGKLCQLHSVPGPQGFQDGALMGTGTQCYLDVRPSCSYLPFLSVPHSPPSPKRTWLS